MFGFGGALWGGRYAAEPAADQGRQEIRFLVIGLIIARQVYAFAPERTQPPDVTLDVGPGARKDARRRRGQFGPGRVGGEVLEVGLVGVLDVEKTRARGAQHKHAQGGARGQPTLLQCGGHGQNPAVIEKKKLRVGGYGPRSMLRTTACWP